MKDLSDQLINWCDSIKPSEIEDVMEWLNDNFMLNEDGIKFRDLFWEKHIKEKRDK